MNIKIIRLALLTAFAAVSGVANADYWLNWQVTGSDIDFAYAAVKATGDGYSALLVDSDFKKESGWDWPYVSAEDGGKTTGIAQGQFTPKAGLENYDFQLQLFSSDYSLIAFSDTVNISNFGSEGLNCLTTDPMYPQEGVWTVTTFHAVPEPTSGMLLLLGVAGLALRRRRS